GGAATPVLRQLFLSHSGGVTQMTGTRTYRPVWLVLPALALAAGPLPAADRPTKEPVKTEPRPLPRPSEIRAIEAYPSFISLKGGDDARQLIVTAALQNGRLQDL